MSNTFKVFQFQILNCDCLTVIEVCFSVRDFFRLWNIVGWKSHFWISQGLILCFSSFFRFYYLLSRVSNVLQFQRVIRCFLTYIEVSHLRRGILVLSNIVKCKSHFSVFLWYHPILRHFYSNLTRGKALKKWQLSTYFTENILKDIQ